MGTKHTFLYWKNGALPSEAFPSETTKSMPFLLVTLKNGPYTVECPALVDSGADRCVFPADLVSRLGLMEKDAKLGAETSGYGSVNGERLPFWPLVLDIAGKLLVKTPTGFSEGLNARKFGVLGQSGFFSEVAKVCFSQRDGWFWVETSD